MAEQAVGLGVVDGGAVDACDTWGLRGIPHYDVRLRRELTHRRLAISLARRVLRILSLHFLDGAVVASLVVLLAAFWHPPLPAREYVPVVVAIFLLSLNALSAYDPGGGRRDRRRLATGVGLAVLILSCLVAFPPYLPLTQAFLSVLGLSSFVVLVAERKLVDLGMRQVYAHGIGLRRAVLIGDLDEVGRTLHAIRGSGHQDQFVVGHLTKGDLDDPTALGSVADLPRVLESADVQEVLVATALPREEADWIASQCFERGVALFVVPSGVAVSDSWAEPSRVGNCPMLQLHPSRLRFPELMAKRAVDVVLASLILVLLSPLIAVLAIAIKLDSPGPVFFRQRRVGLGGRAFTIWKFRSMTADAEERRRELDHLNIYCGGVFKVPNDPRVTAVGRFLRRTSLDELPQLFNVLAGEMSLVGPRPALPSELGAYQAHHYARFSVLPGITGPWQVGGRNLVTDFEKVVKMESAYIEGWSLFVDAKILLRTIPAVVRGEGAY